MGVYRLPALPCPALFAIAKSGGKEKNDLFAFPAANDRAAIRRKRVKNKRFKAFFFDLALARKPVSAKILPNPDGK